ncbi:MAG: response regulator transcription factor [Bacillota bacterium]
MHHILICDDDCDIVSALEIYLRAEGYVAHVAHNGREALEIVKNSEIHLVLMDIMMPGLDGIMATAQLRKNSNIPVILLTAKSEDGDKVLGLSIGADDYVTKPFSPVELLARVKSQLRRYTQLGGMEQKEQRLIIGGVALDDEEKKVTLDGEPVSLTPTEYGILKLLMEQPGRVFSSAQIYDAIWKGSAKGMENTIAVHIRHIREKIEINPAEPRVLKVVWGHGYKMERGLS